MNLKRAQRLFATSRPLPFVIPLLLLLLASLGWNLWHYQFDQERRARANAAEQASIATTALARKKVERAEFSRRAKDARSDARVQQLYDEINQLSRLSEQVLLPDQVDPTTSVTTSAQHKTVPFP
jgi:hypothetical protein